jgi:GNAT superfamily N-acetyltransferase
MAVRELGGSDLDALLALYEDLHSNDDPLPARSSVEHTWESILAGAGSHYLGHFVDGALVSSCALTVVPNLTRGCRPYALVENVVTQAGHRRKGYATSVLRHALELAWSERCYKVMLLTGRSDEGIVAFYEAAGFKPDVKRGFVALPGAGL